MCINIHRKITIYSPSKEQYIQDLNELFLLLEMANLKVSVDKAKLVQHEFLVFVTCLMQKASYQTLGKSAACMELQRSKIQKRFKRSWEPSTSTKIFPGMLTIGEGLLALTCGKIKMTFSWGELILH